MRVRIVCYEDVDGWILGKFAKKLNEELIKIGVHSDIGKHPDPIADINHHIVYLGYDTLRTTTVDTLMITHIDDTQKFSLLSNQMKTAKVGICMSAQVMNELASMEIPANKLCYITPAHDSVMQPRKILIGITSRVYPDGCKREELVEYLFNHISPDIFSLFIMGAGWNKIVERIRERGFLVNYFDEFDREKYIEIVPTLDYYLYTGQDEGSMGFVDALAAGVKTIVTPQGFHLDAPGGISQAFNEDYELVNIFKCIEKEKKDLLAAVKFWTWKDYARKHFEIWNYLIQPQEGTEGSRYNDGLTSLLAPKNTLDDRRVREHKQKLKSIYWRKLYYKASRLKDFKFMRNKIKQVFNKLL